MTTSSGWSTPAPARDEGSWWGSSCAARRISIGCARRSTGWPNSPAPRRSLPPPGSDGRSGARSPGRSDDDGRAMTVLASAWPGVVRRVMPLVVIAVFGAALWLLAHQLASHRIDDILGYLARLPQAKL